MKDIIQGLKPKLNRIFEYLHSNPEIGWQEVKTTAFIKETLELEGIQVDVFEGMTGLVATLGEGQPVVGLRADIDALWQEVDGVFQGNHSCGHDAHITMVLGVIFLLQQLEELTGTYKFIFQPAEEKGTGALEMVRHGVVDEMDFLYGVHLRPQVECPNGMATPAILHGAARFIQGRIVGEDSHGARPHLNANAVQLGADLVHMLNGIHMNPLIPYSVKMTQFQAGGDSPNIIPGSGSFSIDLRAQTNEVMSALTEKVDKIITALCMQYGVEVNTQITANIAAAVESDEATRIMATAIGRVIGEKFLAAPVVTTGGDDFHFYTLERPHLKATMLGLGCGLEPGLHHPRMTFDRNALFVGIEILAQALILTSSMNRVVS